ncbi:hypothetical protein J3E69DRAFT_351045 [Trichoderma sp. SZMC 28015]
MAFTLFASPLSLRHAWAWLCIMLSNLKSGSYRPINQAGVPSPLVGLWTGLDFVPELSEEGHQKEKNMELKKKNEKTIADLDVVHGPGATGIGAHRRQTQWKVSARLDLPGIAWNMKWVRAFAACIITWSFI